MSTLLPQLLLLVSFTIQSHHHSSLTPALLYSQGGLCPPEDQGWGNRGGKEQSVNSASASPGSCDIIHQALGWDHVSFPFEIARMYLIRG